MAEKLEGSERLVLNALLRLQGGENDYVHDARLAADAKMNARDVRDWLETLEGKGFIERARQTDGFSAYVTARGRQALTMTETIPHTPGSGEPGSSPPIAVTQTVVKKKPIHKTAAKSRRMRLGCKVQIILCCSIIIGLTLIGISSEKSSLKIIGFIILLPGYLVFLALAWISNLGR